MNLLESAHYGQIQHSFRTGEKLCKLGRKYFDAPLCKLCAFHTAHLSSTNHCQAVNAQLGAVCLHSVYRLDL